MDIAFSLDQLRVFTAVVDHGGFAAAARALHRTQSAVSYAVSNLERLLGAKLLERGGQGSALTPTGRAILPEARQLLARAEQIQGLAAQHASGVESRLCVAIDQLTPADLVTAALARWQTQFPSTVLDWRHTTLGETAALLHSGAAALGISAKYGPVLDELACSRLREIRMVCVCGRDHPLAVADAVDDDAVATSVQIVLIDPTSRTRGETFTVLRGRKWYVGDIASKRDLLLRGLGWGWMPDHLVADDLADRGLVRLKPQRDTPSATLTLYTVHVRSTPLGPAAAWLNDALHEAAGVME